MAFLIEILVALSAAALSPETAAAGPPPAPQSFPTSDADREDQRFGKIASFISQRKPAKALELIDKIIADQEKAHRGETRQVYAARSPAEAALYVTKGTDKDLVVLGPDWSLALFLKGYVLIDLQRSNESKPWFDKALAMSPVNSHFLGELAEWYKTRRDWAQAYTLFERAYEARHYSPDDLKSFDTRRAMRGMGFVLIEQGKLDEAEALFKKVLQMDPSDAGAKNELQYIEEQRARTSRTT